MKLPVTLGANILASVFNLLALTENLFLLPAISPISKSQSAFRLRSYATFQRCLSSDFVEGLEIKFVIANTHC